MTELTRQNRLDAALGVCGVGIASTDCYSPDMGAPAKATRLTVGLRYLKYTFIES